MNIEYKLNNVIKRFIERYRGIKSVTVSTVDGFTISHVGNGDPEMISAVVSQIIDNVRKLNRYDIFPDAKYISISDEDGNWIYGKLAELDDMRFCIILISRNMHGCQSVLEEIAIEIMRVYIEHEKIA